MVTLGIPSDIDAIARLTQQDPGGLAQQAAEQRPALHLDDRVPGPQGQSEGHEGLGRPGRSPASRSSPRTRRPRRGGRWNFLAAWGYAYNQDKDADKADAFVGQIYKNVPVLDTGARGSTVTFAQRGLGDVLPAWENEAYPGAPGVRRRQVRHRLAAELDPRRAAGRPRGRQRRAQGHDARPPQAYLDFLYTDRAQAIIAKNHYRPIKRESAAPADLAQLPEIKLFTIEDLQGSWDEIQKRNFDAGGLFDRSEPAPGAEARRPWSRRRAAGRWTFRRPSVIPGFGISFGYTLAYLGLIVLLPLAGLVVKASGLGLSGILAGRHRSAGGERAPAQLRRLGAGGARRLRVRLAGGLGADPLPLPGPQARRRAVDLPFALPTAVAGIALASLYAPNGLARRAARAGSASRSPTRRSASSSRWCSSACRSWCARVQPLIAEIDSEIEEASATLGATALATLTRVVLPPLIPAVLDRLRPRLRPRRRRVRLGHLHRRQHALRVGDRAAADRHQARGVRLCRRDRDRHDHAGDLVR